MTNIDDSPEQRDCERIIEDKKRGPLIFDARRIIRRPLDFLKVLSPFLFSHHPNCSDFDGHTFRFRNHDWCIGCFFNNLFFFSALTLLFIPWLFVPSAINSRFLLYGGIGGLVLYFLLTILHLTEKIRMKIVSKLLLGTSFASILFVTVTIGGSIEYMIQEKYILIFLLYFLVLSILMAKRALEIMKTCESCDYKMRWSKCPGFNEIICECIEEGFVKPKQKTSE
ncbi:MAG: hypothetical protein ACTSQZ_05165 [Candidatus Thorarchaeota archaeon]